MVLQLLDVRKHFPARKSLWSTRSWVRAVDGVSFDIEEGQTLGLVGESGSGKSTVGLMVVRLLEPTAGRILYRGKDIRGLSTAEMMEFTHDVRIVFQDPYSSLNPHRTVEQILSRPFKIHGIGRARSRVRDLVLELLADVELNPPQSFVDRYPHEMSGGERQRVAIARAIALKPKLVVADEAVASLDVSIRAQILNLMKRLQRRYGLAYLLITHDLATLRSVSQRTVVMYRGKVMEIGPTEDVISGASHPYTRALLSAAPIPDPVRSRQVGRIELRAEVGSAVEPPPGCRFSTRCPWARQECDSAEPPLLDIGRQQVACIREVAERAWPGVSGAAGAIGGAAAKTGMTWDCS